MPHFGTRTGSLELYLNDHLAGSTGGRDLATRIAAQERGTEVGDELAALSAEITEDRDSLAGIMATLGAPERGFRQRAAWLAEKAGRLKLNGRLFRRSPLSLLIELEMLTLGVRGKAACWEALIRYARHDPRLDVEELRRLLRRAEHQADALERWRAKTAETALGREQHPAP